MKKLFFLFLLISNFMWGQTPQNLFDKANELYKNGAYEEAIKTYEEIESLGLQSSELYYNIGNCYYKLNKVAPTIYNYERALLLDPLNEDAKNNLIFAKRLTIDTIDELPKSVFERLDNSIIKKLSYNNWAWLSIIFSVLGSILFLLFYFSYSSSKKRVFFVLSILSFLLLILSFSFTVKEYNFDKNNKNAIIFSEEIEIKNAPTINSDIIFTLHEGTKVKVLDDVDDWIKIQIADGQVGWIKSDKLKLINF